MDPYRMPRASLAPGDALVSRIGQVYNPSIQAFRSQRVGSLTSSADSLPRDYLMEINLNSQRTSTSSYASLASNNSIRSAHTNSTSLASQRSSLNVAQQKLRSNEPPSPIFQWLPPAIYDCILQQLTMFHEESSSLSCQTCYLRDLCALALTSRAWDKAVRTRLYERIYIVGADHKDMMKRYKLKTGVRLKLLRRTLRERRVLAQCVLELKVPGGQWEQGTISKDIIDLTASIVMSCPNLEKLTGFYPVYSHEFDRLTHALSTRRKLTEHTWIIGENEAITQRSQKQLPPGLMDSEQAGAFYRFHDAWSSLTTLFLHSHNQGILEREIFVDILHSLPSLRHLFISSFDMDDFDDITLQQLPPLESLRLQDLEGVTFWGLSEFARAPSSQGIRRLALINLDITYLSAISKLLLHLDSLERFTLVQESSPEVATGELVFQPIVASKKLRFLHWDILLPGSANGNIADSIRANGFPSLRTVRAPSDHQGLLQDVCKPRAYIESPRDKWSKPSPNGVTSGQGDLTRNLIDARKQAQQRIEEARKTVQFKVIVEQDGVVTEIYDLNGFMGTIGSKIRYSLEPDIAGHEDALIDFKDLHTAKLEANVKRGQGCRGLWNASYQGGKKWWEHEERYRYQPLELGRFF